MGLFDSAKNLYDAAKVKAAETLNEALDGSDSELAQTLREVRDGIREEKKVEEIKVEGTVNQGLGGEPNFVPAVCTQCGAPITVDPTQEAAVCSHCGTPFVVAKAISQYNVTRADINASKVEVHKKGNVEAALNYVERRREQKKEEERRAEEERKIREMEEKAKADAARMKRQAWFRQYGAQTIKFGLIAVAVLALVITASLAISRRGKIKVGVSSSTLLSNNYDFAQEKLSSAGFFFFLVIPDPDLIIGWLNKDGQVKTVTVGDKTSFSSSAYFNPDDPVVITYHTFPESSPEPEEVQEVEEEIEPVEAEAPAPSSETVPASAYDTLDSDLIVVKVTRDPDKTTMYDVMFGEPGEGGGLKHVYYFDDIINPRAMGKEFNAIGDLPSWFYEGATVHVKAKLDGSVILESGCEVTQSSNVLTVQDVKVEEDASETRYSDDEVKSILNTLLGTAFKSSEYKVEVESPMLTISFYPEGFTQAAYQASVLGDSSAVKSWNSLVDSAKQWSKDITKQVHENMGRDDLTVVLYYCDDMNADGNVFLAVMNGDVYLDIVNDINLLS